MVQFLSGGICWRATAHKRGAVITMQQGPVQQRTCGRAWQAGGAVKGGRPLGTWAANLGYSILMAGVSLHPQAPMIPVTPIITRLSAERYGASFPDAGGALGSEENIRRILGAAGYTDIQVLRVPGLPPASTALLSASTTGLTPR